MDRKRTMSVLVLFIMIFLSGCVVAVNAPSRKVMTIPDHQPPVPQGSTMKPLTGPLHMSQIGCEEPAHWEARDGNKWVCATPNIGGYLWPGYGYGYGYPYYGYGYGYPYYGYGYYGYPYMYGYGGWYGARFW